MSDPKQEQQPESNELDLDAETVRDLELGDQDAEAAKGGNSVGCVLPTQGNLPGNMCRPSAGCQIKGG